MIQLLLHLWGDYFFQVGKWANLKRSNWKFAAIHGTQYGLGFLLAGLILKNFQCSLMAFAVITSTHIIIDRTYPVRYWLFAKNWIGRPSLKWEDCSGTGYHKDTPKHISFWLMIIADNTLHLTINYIALACL